MSTFSHDQKIALLVVPILLFGILGLSGTGRGITPTSGEDEVVLRRNQSGSVRIEPERRVSGLLRSAIQNKNYLSFVAALKETPYEAYADREIFDVLVQSYELRKNERGDDANEEFVRMLYG